MGLITDRVFTVKPKEERTVLKQVELIKGAMVEIENLAGGANENAENAVNQSNIANAKANQALTNSTSAIDTANESITKSNTAITESNNANTNANTAIGIAQGKTTSYVFNTKQELDTWLTIPDNVNKLRIGDNLFIVALDTPDYWWDGTSYKILETQKVDLTNYATLQMLENAVIPILPNNSNMDNLNENSIYRIKKDFTYVVNGENVIFNEDGFLRIHNENGNILQVIDNHFYPSRDSTQTKSYTPYQCRGKASGENWNSGFVDDFYLDEGTDISITRGKTSKKQNYTKIDLKQSTKDKINNAESKSNKVTSISESSTDMEYPSAKAIYNFINNSNNNIKIISPNELDSTKDSGFYFIKNTINNEDLFFELEISKYNGYINQIIKGSDNPTQLNYKNSKYISSRTYDTNFQIWSRWKNHSYFQDNLLFKAVKVDSPEPYTSLNYLSTNYIYQLNNDYLFNGEASRAFKCWGKDVSVLSLPTSYLRPFTRTALLEQDTDLNVYIPNYFGEGCMDYCLIVKFTNSNLNLSFNVLDNDRQKIVGINEPLPSTYDTNKYYVFNVKEVGYRPIRKFYVIEWHSYNEMV